MSSDIVVYSAYGYIFPQDAENFSGFLDKLKSVLPKTVAASTYGEHCEDEEFLWNSTELYGEFEEKYPGLKIEVIDTISSNAGDVMVLLSESIIYLYSKDKKFDSGALYLKDIHGGADREFDSFKQDFNVSSEPESLLFRTWR